MEKTVLLRLGKFEILRLLAQGSMGEVYVGLDPLLGREVAIKVIHASAGLGPGARERFVTEARAAAALNHPNIVTIHELGEEQGVLYIAMELVKGEDLGTLIHAGTLLPPDALEVLAQVCDGLAVAHRHQILHRDIKPSNIRVTWDGNALQAKVLDFGVAKIFNSDTTDEGTVLGTVNYMAPEYLQSGHPEPRSDLFAVGVILYEALAGLPPFDGPTPGAVVYRLLHETPAPLPPLGYRGISRDIQKILNQALAKDPANRFQTAEELAAVLRRARNTGWRQDQDGPTQSAPLRALAAAQGSSLPTPPRGIPVQPPTDWRGSRGPDPAPTLAPTPVLGNLHGRAEVRKDVLEAARRQLLQAIEIDPGHVQAQAMLLATLYRLGQTEALMQGLRRVRDRGIPATALKRLPRCAQMVSEEEQVYRLPLELHGEFMAYFGS